MIPTPVSRQQFVVTRPIAAPAIRAFDILTSETGMQSWIPLCRTATWLHPPLRKTPGTDSVRSIVLAGGIIASERIIAWEQGRALQYTFDATTLPIARLTRNYVGTTQFESDGGDRCVLTWAIHFDAPGILVPFAPLVRSLLKPLISLMSDKLVKLAEGQAA